MADFSHRAQSALREMNCWVAPEAEATAGFDFVGFIFLKCHAHAWTRQNHTTLIFCKRLKQNVNQNEGELKKQKAKRGYFEGSKKQNGEKRCQMFF